MLTLSWLLYVLGFPQMLLPRNPLANAGDMRLRFNLWVEKIPWKRAWLPTPVFLLRESNRQRNLSGYGPWGSKESDTIEQASITTIPLLLLCLLLAILGLI